MTPTFRVAPTPFGRFELRRRTRLLPGGWTPVHVAAFDTAEDAALFARREYAGAVVEPAGEAGATVLGR